MVYNLIQTVRSPTTEQAYMPPDALAVAGG
jgi:hypothetical protein